LLIQNHAIVSSLELKPDIFNKLKSVYDADLLKQIENLLQPLDPNEIKLLNENKLVNNIEDNMKFENEISEEQLKKIDSEWIIEL
jgi:hypothetical protein